MAVLLLLVKKQIHARMSKKDTNKEADLEETLANEPTQETPVEAQVVVEDERTTEEKLSEDLQNEKDKHLRLFAEFENYKKRTGRERIELFKTAGQEVVMAVLPVLDDFDRALKEFSEDQEDVHVQGMVLISNKLKENMKQKGLEVSQTIPGDVFNADNHEAVTQIPAPTDDMKGKIIDVLEKGYTLGGKIIRYPKVVIGQ
jgi:molecular chaperone GrpE|tara:strand:+ start:95 stop:697 length:603 start_codon:yes stop_codon:yes gene_type:complete